MFTSLQQHNVMWAQIHHNHLLVQSCVGHKPVDWYSVE